MLRIELGYGTVVEHLSLAWVRSGFHPIAKQDKCSSSSFIHSLYKHIWRKPRPWRSGMSRKIRQLQLVSDRILARQGNQTIMLQRNEQCVRFRKRALQNFKKRHKTNNAGLDEVGQEGTVKKWWYHSWALKDKKLPWTLTVTFTYILWTARYGYRLCWKCKTIMKYFCIFSFPGRG